MFVTFSSWPIKKEQSDYSFPSPNTTGKKKKIDILVHTFKWPLVDNWFNLHTPAYAISSYVISDMQFLK
jgi:hypothetical protein